MIKYDIREVSSFAANRKLIHSNRCKYYTTIVSEIILRYPNNKSVIKNISIHKRGISNNDRT